MYDFRLAWRGSLRRPSFTLGVVLAVALGVGAVSAVFSVVWVAVLRPLPYPSPEDLVVLTMENPETGFPGGRVSLADFLDLEERGRTFRHLAAVSDEAFVLTGVDRPERIPGARVTSGFFGVVGLAPERGGIDTTAWDRPGVHLAVVSHRLWQRRFGGGELLGRSLTLDDETYTVVAVMPPQLDLPRDAEIWLPLDRSVGADIRSGRFLQAVGRLGPAVSLARANAEVAALVAQLAEEYPDTNEGYTAVLTPLHERLVGDVRPALMVLLAAVAFVLFIVCADVAGLLLARGAHRMSEFRMQVALGGTRSRLIRQLLVESCLLALSGGVVGLFVGVAGSRLMVSLYPQDLYGGDAVGFDPVVIGFGLAVSLAAGLLFGLAPVFQMSRTRLGGTPQKGSLGASSNPATRRTQASVLVLQLAVTLVLLVGAALMIHSLIRLTAVDPGFRTRGILTARIALPGSRYPEPSLRAAFFRDLLERLENAPGVGSAAAVTNLPLSGSNMLFGASLEDSVGEGPRENLRANYRAASPGYFSTLGITVKQGRRFTAADDPGASPVVIVNETFVERYLAGSAPLGRRIRITFGDGAPRRIVGVVEDVRHFDLGRAPEPEMYVPYLQQPWPFMTLTLRTAGKPEDLVPTLRAQVAALDPDQPVDRIQTLREVVSDSVAQPRFFSALLGVFAGLALLTAAVGIYGLNAYWVSLRLPEVAVRMALGAAPADIRRFFVRQPLELALVGACLGTVVALGLVGSLTGMLYGVEATDPWTFLVMVPVLVGIAGLAAYLPARRASRVDPMSLLREA